MPQKSDPPRIPYGTTAYYAGLALSKDPDSDPIAAQIYPREAEQHVEAYETADPIGDQQYMISERLIHHYHDRALLLANDRCATYCRHCFRRHFTGNDSGKITPAQLQKACQALSIRPEIEEIVISGGDPLMLSDNEIERILKALTSINPDYILRIATRIPVVFPRRITQSLVSILQQQGSVWMVIHVNHPREITPEFSTAIQMIRGAGIPILNQAVLLHGVNDSVDIQEALSRNLLKNGIKPYYLFQGDLAAGTKHFRTSIESGLRIMDELRSRVSGMGIPTYAVDLPDGGGKIALHSGSIQRIEDGWYILLGPDNREYRYPREK